MSNDNFERINLLITIINRGFGEKVIKDLREMGVTYNMTAVGSRSLGFGMADYLGLASSEADIILSIVPDSKIDKAMALIEYAYDDSEEGGGIAALIPVSGVSGPMVLEYISGIALMV